MTFSVPVAMWVKGDINGRTGSHYQWPSSKRSKKAEGRREVRNTAESGLKAAPCSVCRTLICQKRGPQRRWATAYLKPSTSVCLWPAFSPCWKRYDHSFLTKDTYIGQREVTGTHSGRPSQGRSSATGGPDMNSGSWGGAQSQPGLVTWLG